VGGDRVGLGWGEGGRQGRRGMVSCGVVWCSIVYLVWRQWDGD